MKIYRFPKGDAAQLIDSRRLLSTLPGGRYSFKHHSVSSEDGPVAGGHIMLQQF
jgi:hypothetical protein